MRIEEMKLEAINEISKIESKEELQEVLLCMKEISLKKSTSLNLSQHYDTVSKQYAGVLKQLAQ